MRENADQNNTEYGQFLRSERDQKLISIGILQNKIQQLLFHEDVNNKKDQKVLKVYLDSSLNISEAYLEPSRTSAMKLKAAKSPSLFSQKNFSVNVRLGSKYASEFVIWNRSDRNNIPKNMPN